MIDSHTHLDRGPAPEAELVAQAADVGVTRILTIGMDAESRRKALQAAETYDEVYAAIGHHPNEATGYTDAITAELRELAQHREDLPGRFRSKLDRNSVQTWIGTRGRQAQNYFAITRATLASSDFARAINRTWSILRPFLKSSSR